MGKTAFYHDHSAVRVHKRSSHSQQSYGGALLAFLFHQMSAEEGKFLLQSPVPCKQGVKSASLQTH